MVQKLPRWVNRRRRSRVRVLFEALVRTQVSSNTGVAHRLCITQFQTFVSLNSRCESNEEQDASGWIEEQVGPEGVATGPPELIHPLTRAPPCTENDPFFTFATMHTLPRWAFRRENRKNRWSEATSSDIAHVMVSHHRQPFMTGLPKPSKIVSIQGQGGG